MKLFELQKCVANVFKLVALLSIKIFILEKEMGRGRNQKATPLKQKNP